MTDFLTSNYLWLQALHIISVICWMAGLLYLPRLFVYHAQNNDKENITAVLKVMEYKLYRFIMNPAMMASWTFGILMIIAYPSIFEQGWIHAKLTLVVIMTVFHVILGRWVKRFAREDNLKNHVFYRWANEIPTILMILIVILAVVKPF